MPPTLQTAVAARAVALLIHSIASASSTSDPSFDLDHSAECEQLYGVTVTRRPRMKTPISVITDADLCEPVQSG